jgi:uncharacterized repeat protein (TIGR02543 family)
VSAIITVYAQWTAKIYTVTFNKNNTTSGSTEASPATKTVTVPATTINALPTAPTRTGYTFTGWNTQSNGLGTPFVQTTTVSASITVYAQWKSSNANIRAVSSGASGNANTPLGTFGLYVGGIPATSNGTPSTTNVITGTGTGAPTNGTIGGNSTSDAANSPIVVIVEDPTVSKVEFGRNGATSDTTAPTWQTLTRTNDADTPTSLTDKRWVGKLAEKNDTNNWRFWVRITAEDGTTTNIYRYTHNVGSTAGYGTLSSLTIDKVTATLGTGSGWWNTTVAPNLAVGNATIVTGNNVLAAWNIGSTNTSYNYAIIPKTVTMPLKEGDYTPTFITGNPASINLNDGDYILLRAQCTPGGATSVPIVGHYLFKVSIPPAVDITIGPGSSYTFSRLPSGYTQRFPRTITLSNSGNQPTGNLTVKLTGTNSSSFEFDSATNTVINGLASGGLSVGQSVSLAVMPKAGLAAGTYSATVNITGGNGIGASYAISVTVSSQPAGPAYIGITSDVHYGRNEESSNTTPNLFETWMNKLKTRYTNLDYMLFCGDNGSAYAPGLTFWTNVQSIISLADKFAPSFVLNQNIFITGNHEWQNTAGGALLANWNNANAQNVIPRLNIEHNEAVRTSSYAIYAFGPKPETQPPTTFQEFTAADKAALGAYLATAPTDIPIILLTHFPLHCIPEPDSSTSTKRYTEYASDMIELLNNYPNVVFLWGHNHSNSDPMYKSIQGPGYTMSTTSGTSSTVINKKINFLYVPAGCMRDVEYNDESANIYDKGLVLKIDGKQLTFTYYDKDCSVTNKSGWEATAVYNLTGNGYVKQ